MLIEFFSVFEAFGKIIDINLPPDPTRPGKHRYAHKTATKVDIIRCTLKMNDTWVYWMDQVSSVDSKMLTCFITVQPSRPLLNAIQ